jgi:hypothetical protein
MRTREKGIGRDRRRYGSHSGDGRRAAKRSTGKSDTRTKATGVPATPSGLMVEYEAGPLVALIWNDNSDNEGGFIIQRKVIGSEWKAVFGEFHSFLVCQHLTGSGRFQVDVYFSILT